ncbi:MAG: hypothetical protein ABIP20_19830 [Chthoniobacteraceae bacterium]
MKQTRRFAGRTTSAPHKEATAKASRAMPKHLAITISGPVSLGNYEAGVLNKVIYAPKDSELASGNLFAFAGFVERRIRDHDYAIGREKTRAFLISPELSKPGELGPIRFIPEALRKLLDLGGTTIADLDETVRKRLQRSPLGAFRRHPQGARHRRHSQRGRNYPDCHQELFRQAEAQQIAGVMSEVLGSIQSE